MLQIQGRLLNTFFKPNGFCVNLLTLTFRRKKHKYPTKARVVARVVVRSVPRATQSKRSVGMRAQKQVVSGQSVKSNAISVF